MPRRQSETIEPIRGACLCGAVSFEIAPPYHWLAHCHCSMCRKHHGTLFGTGLGVERSRFRWLTGQDEIVHYRSTDSFERAFCRRCGSKVPGDSHLADVVLVPAGTLEGDFGIRPRAHIFVGSKSPLYKINDDLTQFEAYPPGVDLAVVERPQSRTRPGAVVGSCLCGDVGFEVSGELGRIVHCHCSLCRRSRGTAFASTLFCAPERFRWTRGKDRVRGFRLPPPRTYEVDFCARCGSPVPTVVPDFGLVLIPAGSVDTSLRSPTAVHIHVGSKAVWHDITDSAPQFAEMPPPDRFAEFFL
jgi:hypothetical protein